MRDVLARHFASSEVKATKHDGGVSIDWVTVAMVQAPRRGDMQVWWNSPTLENVGLTEDLRAQIKKEWAAALGKVPAEQWRL